MTKPIGGHPGMEIYREGGIIVKKINRDAAPERYAVNHTALHNEAKFLRVMSGSGYTPEMLSEDDTIITQTDCGDSERVMNGQNFRRELFRFLREMRRRNVRHTNLNGNVIVKNDWPWIIDWQESHFITEKPGPGVQGMSDTWGICRTAMDEISGETGAADEYRVAQKWLAVVGKMGAVSSLKLPLKGKTLLDVGCFQGDYVAAASCEGMEARGIDSGGFRSGEDSIEIARDLWSGMGCEFTKTNAVDWHDYEYDVVLFFSAYPYIAHDHGRAAADKIIEQIVAQAGVLFFETQLYGDGPGPDFFKTDEDVERLLSQYGVVEKVITMPVWNRPATRTVWEVKRS